MRSERVSVGISVQGKEQIDRCAQDYRVVVRYRRSFMCSEISFVDRRGASNGLQVHATQFDAVRKLMDCLKQNALGY